MADEKGDRGEVGRHVHDLGRYRRLEKILSEKSDEQEDQEAAGAGSKESVVEAECETDGADDRDLHAMGMRGRAREFAEILAHEGIDRNAHEKDQDQRPDQLRGEMRHRLGAEPGPEQGRAGGRQRQAPRYRDPSRVLDCGAAGADHAGELVGTEQHRGTRPWEGGKEQRDLHQPSSTDDGVDQSRDEGSNTKDDEESDGKVGRHGCCFAGEGLCFT